ncbi:MAG: tetratricopeptide repeat protein [Candidatus Heimdallarchaeota archaeon]
MSLRIYEEVKRLISQHRISDAEKIHGQLKETTIGGKFWTHLITGELTRHKRDFDKAKVAFEEALSLAPQLNLITEHQSLLAKIQGKLGSISYHLHDYSTSFALFETAANSTEEDPPRHLYYLSQLIRCTRKLHDEEGFSRILYQGLRYSYSKLSTHWLPALDFCWVFTQGISEIHWEGLVQKAVSKLKKSDHLHESNLLEGYLLFIQARINQSKRDRESFLESMKNCLHICQDESSDIRTNLFLNFATILVNPFDEYHWAIELLENALALLDRSSYRRLIILNKLGSNLRFTGEYTRAINYLQEALKLNSEVFKYHWHSAFSHNVLGMIYTVIGDHKSATTHYKASLDDSRDDDKLGMGYTYGALGWLEITKGDQNKAKKYYEKSLSCFNKPPVVILLAYAELLSSMGSRYVKESQKLCEQAWLQIKDNPRSLDKGRYYNTLGTIALNRRELQLAEKHFFQALQWANTFEVETGTLIGLTKLSLESYLASENEEDLHKVNLFLNDLKSASQVSVMFRDEVDLILGTFEMAQGHLLQAKEVLSRCLTSAKLHNFIQLQEKVQRQQDILDAFIIQTKILNLAEKIHIPWEIKEMSLKEAKQYLRDLTRFLAHSSAHKKTEEDQNL